VALLTSPSPWCCVASVAAFVRVTESEVGSRKSQGRLRVSVFLAVVPSHDPRLSTRKRREPGLQAGFPRDGVGRGDISRWWGPGAQGGWRAPRSMLAVVASGGPTLDLHKVYRIGGHLSRGMFRGVFGRPAAPPGNRQGGARTTSTRELGHNGVRKWRSRHEPRRPRPADRGRDRA